MSWILVIWLLGAGGRLQETQATDEILKINEELLSGNDPTSGQIFEGDIIEHEQSAFSSSRFLWPWVGEKVVIPYVLHEAYGDRHKRIIFDAFKDLEVSTCVRFVERKTEEDYISVEPRDGCYSNVGHVGGKQLVSLAFECIRQGKGVALHELLHVLGFWHEHSRADRDKYVKIIWSVIKKEAWRNFCKHETTNMLSRYAYDSLLHYSSTAFSLDGSESIKALMGGVTNMGQRIKLSKSDILRVNKLYHCPEYVPSEDETEGFEGSIETAFIDTLCSEAQSNPISGSAAVNSLMAELGPLSPPPMEESKMSKDAPHSSSPEPRSATTSFFNQESTLVPNSFLYSSTQEPTNSITNLTMPSGGATLESLESIQDNSTELIPHQATDLLQNGSNMGTGHNLGVPLDFNTTAFPNSSFTGEENGTKRTTKDEAVTASPIRESLTDAIPPTPICMLKRTLADVDIIEGSGLQTSASSQSGEMQQATTKDLWTSSGSGWTYSGSGEGVNVAHEDHERVKRSPLLNIVRKMSLAGNTLGSRSEHHPRLINGNKLTLSYNNRRKKSSEMKPFCGFEHGFCGWEQSAEDDLDWKLSWKSMNVNAGSIQPKGFHLSLKSNPENAVSEQKALLLRPIVQPSNCISFWYGSRNSNMGTLNVYIASSGKEQTLLWSSGDQDHVKRTRAQIMLPPHLLYSNAHVIVEGIVRPSDQSGIAIDDLYVGQCS